MPPVFLTAEWRSLLMINYTVDRTLLEPLLPQGVELDLWQGEAVASMVGFMFLKCRVLGLRVPFHQNFEEVNLRFYVRREVDGEMRRGVVFIKEVVPKLAIAVVARLFYNEQYSAQPMRHRLPLGADRESSYEYGWKSRRGWHSLSAQTIGPLEPIPSGSEAEFIFEHYWGYARQRDGGTVEYQVEHPRWQVWPTVAARFEGLSADLYGPAWVAPLSAPPRSAFVAEGSPVEVWRGQRIV